MKYIPLLVVLAVSLVGLGACVAMTQGGPGPSASPLTAPGGDSPLRPDTMAVTGQATVTLTLAPTITPTVVLTASPTISSTASPIAPTDGPPEMTETVEPTGIPTSAPTGAPTETPVPEPTASPTPEPPTATPTVTPTEGPSPTPTPLPEAVFVRDHSMVRRGSDMLVVGEVTNGSGNPIYHVTVSAAFYDQGGNLIGAQEARAFLPQTLTTQNNPFKIVLANAPASVSSYELALRWDDLTALGFDRITVVSEELETDPTVTVHGEVRNDGFSPMSNIAVAVTFYDADGHVTDALAGSAGSMPLEPGATTTYRAETGRGVLEFDRFLVQAQGVLGR